MLLHLAMADRGLRLLMLGGKVLVRQVVHILVELLWVTRVCWVYLCMLINVHVLLARGYLDVVQLPILHLITLCVPQRGAWRRQGRLSLLVHYA